MKLRQDPYDGSRQVPYDVEMATALPQFSHYPAIPPPIDVVMAIVPERTCVYLPDRLSRSRAFWAREMAGSVYQAFMDAGFRRSGQVLYQPICLGCRACQPLRIPVERFQPGKSQRRCWRRNLDLCVTVEPPRASPEKFDLYRRYVTGWHGGKMEEQSDGFEQFLYRSPVPSLEFCYREKTGSLLAVGICDRCPNALSSVYFYFDPAYARRGLGTFGALYELDYATKHQLAHYYLGYWIADCGAMRYKADFRPCEILGHDQVWRPSPDASAPRSPGAGR